MEVKDIKCDGQAAGSSFDPAQSQIRYETSFAQGNSRTENASKSLLIIQDNEGAVVLESLTENAAIANISGLVCNPKEIASDSLEENTKKHTEKTFNPLHAWLAEDETEGCWCPERYFARVDK